MTTELDRPWLVATWPGMGGIAQIAGGHLVASLQASKLDSLPLEKYFETRSIRINAGLIETRERPEGSFYGWSSPDTGRDLLVFVGEEQPRSGGYAYCLELLEAAARYGVQRAVTFAAMAAPVRPEAPSRVTAAATRPEILEEARRHGAESLQDGEISGLNGVLLAAAVERGLDGLCLLGEFPYFASSIANPKASASILRVFSALAGIPLDLSRLDAQAEEVEKVLVASLRRVEESTARADPSITAEGAEEEGLPPAVQQRIETLFEQARSDRSKALELKTLLDRNGVFDDFEDRFLDLFKQAE